jgi:hypothetical protein
MRIPHYYLGYFFVGCVTRKEKGRHTTSKKKEEEELKIS